MKNLIVLSVVRPASNATDNLGQITSKSSAASHAPIPVQGGHSKLWVVTPPAPAAPPPKRKRGVPAEPVKPAEPVEPPTVRECWEIPILFEDAHLLVVSKPAQLLVTQDPHQPEVPCLMGLLQQEITRGAGWVRERKIEFLGNTHKLDPEVSGLLVLAKDRSTLAAMASLFGSLKPMLSFVAIVHGAPTQPEMEVDAKLAPHRQRPGLMRIDNLNGKISKTLFKLRESFRDCSLVDCQPLTLRNHQIRVHLQNFGVSLVSDSVYGGPPLWLSEIKKRFHLKEGHKEQPLLTRPALHSERLECQHPVTGQELRVEAPWPKDLTVAVKYLRRYAAQPSPANPPGSLPETEMGSA